MAAGQRPAERPCQGLSTTRSAVLRERREKLRRRFLQIQHAGQRPSHKHVNFNRRATHHWPHHRCWCRGPSRHETPRRVSLREARKRREGATLEGEMREEEGQSRQDHGRPEGSQEVASDKPIPTAAPNANTFHRRKVVTPQRRKRRCGRECGRKEA